MKSVEEIKRDIGELSARDLAELVGWLSAHHGQVWDQQIEADLAAGRLDDLLDQVDAECAAGLSERL